VAHFSASALLLAPSLLSVDYDVSGDVRKAPTESGSRRSIVPLEVNGESGFDGDKRHATKQPRCRRGRRQSVAGCGTTSGGELNTVNLIREQFVNNSVPNIG
jgi:hypothetical protein